MFPFGTQVTVSKFRTRRVSFELRDAIDLRSTLSLPFASHLAVKIVGDLAGLDAEKLAIVLTKRTTVTRGETFVTPLSSAQVRMPQ